MFLNLVDHKLFIEIRSRLIDLLEKESKNGLNEQDTEILDLIVEELALEYRSWKRDIRNEEIYNKLLFYPPLLNVIKANIDNISLKSSYDPVSDSSEKHNDILPYYIRFITFDGYLEKSIIDDDVIDAILQVSVLYSTCLMGHKLFPKIISILTNLFDKWLTLNEHDKL
ncbi:unnamed protein product, partial [Didymodactylos carnosus]